MALPRSFCASILRGLQRMEFINLIDVAASALQQFGAIIVLFLGGGLLQVTLWMAACYLLGLVLYLSVCAHFFGARAFIPKHFHFSDPSQRRFYVPACRDHGPFHVHTQTDKAIVSKLLPLGIFGYYGMAYSGVSRGMVVTASASQAVFPSFSALYKQGDRDGLMRQYNKLQDLLSLPSWLNSTDEEWLMYQNFCGGPYEGHVRWGIPIRVVFWRLTFLPSAASPVRKRIQLTIITCFLHISVLKSL